MLDLEQSEHEHGAPEYLWIPPETLAEFQQLDPMGVIVMDKLGPVPPVLEQEPNKDPEPSSGRPPSMVPHPLSDFGHIEPHTPYFENNKDVLNNAPGFHRLQALFAFLMQQVSQILNRLNEAKSQTEYEEARHDYIHFLADLDDAEMGSGVRPGGPGYGRIIKWVHVAPAIDKPAGGTAKIRTVQFIVKWNPHSSSSAVGIP